MKSSRLRDQDGACTASGAEHSPPSLPAGRPEAASGAACSVSSGGNQPASYTLCNTERRKQENASGLTDGTCHRNLIKINLPLIFF